MPFTPFHLGPGALFKGAGDTRFSFMVFGGSQVLMDIEPLIRIAQRVTAMIGTYSHIVLDGMMHQDMVPLWLVDGNPLLGVFDVGFLHVLCLLCAIVGGIALAVRWSMRNDDAQ